MMDDAALARALPEVIGQIQPAACVSRFWRLGGGMSAEMVAIEFTARDGETGRYVIRWYDPQRFDENPPSLNQEYQLLQLLAAYHIAAPRAYLFDASLQHFPQPYLLIEFVPGEMFFKPAEPASHVAQLAHMLAAIHAINGPQRMLAFLPHMAGCAELQRERRQPLAGLDDSHIRAALSQHLWPNSRNHPTLLHGDFWPGNTLWLDGQLTAVIDWEDAHVGEPLSDFAKSRMEIAIIFGLEAMDHFSAQYLARHPLDLDPLPYYDLCAVLRFMRLADGDLTAMARYFDKFGRADITAASLAAACHAVTQAALNQLRA